MISLHLIVDIFLLLALIVLILQGWQVIEFLRVAELRDIAKKKTGRQLSDLHLTKE